MRRTAPAALFVFLVLAAAISAENFPPVTLSHVGPPPRTPAIADIHPAIRFVDRNGAAVVVSGEPLSLANTCGGCHDADYIREHNYHASVGLTELVAPGTAASGRPWDISPGIFGRWSPLTYRVLTPASFDGLDMSAPDWIMTMGARHVGGGPAEVSRSGEPLTELEPGPEPGPDTHIIDPKTGRPAPWDWKKSGAVELNCLLCHMENPNNVERIRALESGRFKWASTATLVGSGMVVMEGDTFSWSPTAFERDGYASNFRPRDPDSRNCMLCHARACSCEDPVLFTNSTGNWMVETTGEVFSPERIRDSGMNISGKEGLGRPWDAHAERLLECADCHYSLNNPINARKESGAGKPAHLVFDARRLGMDQYLARPSHQFAKGHTAQGTLARDLDDTMRDCRDCHDPYAAHDFLPYKKLHFAKLSCQACHVNYVNTPTRKSMDWTVLQKDGTPVVEHRGVEGPVNDPSSLITGFKPTLIEHVERDGAKRLGPHSLLSYWFWVEGDPARPVSEMKLKAAFFAGEGEYHPDILKAMDSDGDGDLAPSELILNTQAKTRAVAERLKAAGADAPRIMAEIQPYTLSHGVAAGDYSLSDCMACHSDESRVMEPVSLAGRAPGGVIPGPVGDSRISLLGDLAVTEGGELMLEPTIDPDMLYIHGSGRYRWLDLVGILAVIGSAIGAGVHGGLRYVTSRKRKGS